MTSVLHSGSSGDRTVKRRRITLACSSCRTRKSKCDARRPACTTCASLGFKCNYDSTGHVTTASVQQSLLASLEERVRSLESIVQQHDDHLQGRISNCESVAQAVSPRRFRERTSAPKGQAHDDIQLDVSAVQDVPSEDSGTDGLAMTFVKEQASAFFGESSNIAFARHLLLAIGSTSKTKPCADDLVLTSGNRFVESRSSGFGQEHYPSAIESPEGTTYSGTMLPPIVEMERLLAIYFGSTATLFPFIHEPSFRQTFDEFKASGFSRVRRTWLGLLNIIFAMASNVRIDDNVSGVEKTKTSHVYYVRAVTLCGAPSRQTVSLEIVQYLLLIVLYLQGSQQSTPTWGVHGLLVKTATALGLHSEVSYKALDSLQQEVRRRTWFTVYCLDKVLSLTFGRPCSIPEEHMTVRSPASAGSLRPPVDARSWGDSETSAEFLYVSVELYKIMGRSLVKQYDSNIGRQDADYDVLTTVQRVSEMRQELREWSLALPSHLLLCEPASALLRETDGTNRLRVVLTLRYHNLNILIHRPLVHAMLRALVIDPTLSRDDALHFVAARSQECVSSAEATIDIIHAILTTDNSCNNNLGVWFFTLYYVLTATLVIYSYIIWAQHGTNVKDDTAIARGHLYLVKVNEALEHLGHDILLVHSCSRYIHYLSSLLKCPSKSMMQRSTSTNSWDTLPASNFNDARNEEFPIDAQAASLSGSGIVGDPFGYDGDISHFFSPDIFNSVFSDTLLP